MNLDSKIYVAGHRGLVGSALMRQLKSQDYSNIVTRTHAELDLTDQIAVANFFQTEKPEYVVLAAAKVGGIYANNTYPAEFIFSNIAIQTNVIHQAYLNNVERLLFLGSSCIYPRDCAQPIQEDYLLTGPLEPTNRPYALAKIAGIEMCWSYNRQYGTKFLAAMPTNCYGPEDNYDLNTSHVLPALIRKVHEAKQSNAKEIIIWGTGKPRREFIYSDDLADGCIYLLNLASAHYDPMCSNQNSAPLINIGAGIDCTILELANKVAEVIGFKGNIQFDRNKPDGTMRKLLSIDKIKQLGWKPQYTLDEGLKLAYQNFKTSLKVEK
ncbi:MAG TPA: GDP-L-fucose synthase [Methylotenera sp.]|nr:GDP-L-fucose synthase [Methylotenera sp.]